MVTKQPTLEEALLQKIECGEGNLYQLLIFAHESGVSFKKIDGIIKKHLKNNTLTKIGYKYVIKRS